MYFMFKMNFSYSIKGRDYGSTQVGNNQTFL